MDIKTSLASFYDAQAEKYYHTRNKHRADADIFLNEINSSGKKTVNILEFGCGSGRLLAHLAQLKWIKINYIGVDISKKLLAFAKKQINGKSAPKHITATFVCDDIIHYMKWTKQESFDFVIGIASFQHIPTIKERFFLTKNAYRILKYEGKLLMTNRSFSRRFLKKYQKDFLSSLWKYISTLGKHQWNDLMIPWKDGKTTSKRFYHIYTLAELKKFVSLSGFITEKICYLSKGNTTNSWKDAKNSLVIAKKSIFAHDLVAQWEKSALG